MKSANLNFLELSGPPQACNEAALPLPFTSTRSRIMDFSLGSFAITLSGHNTFGTTPLGKSSAQRRDLYLAQHYTQKRPTSMPPAELKPAIPASQWLQTHALDCAATGIGHVHLAENIQHTKW